MLRPAELTERYGWDVTYTLLVVAAVITAALFLLADRTENAQSD
ncbi:hypothetical protein Ae406Ps2_6052 [Pseudonocardia sp. Ae406_Ps2]|nr:hypothetical protein Ae331Ps2_6117c [Pseudonocardia sp. Ae331_Ps2]OLL96216.1 hypothetical protein Ae406Ps2_6052 [Pseudonocardia sp. Ae406_Ps2]OLM28814.1 hypothetical protein Ae717Ps2_6133c [Pseudonocardia sp. Ae717_Ps2]